MSLWLLFVRMAERLPHSEKRQMNVAASVDIPDHLFSFVGCQPQAYGLHDANVHIGIHFYLPDWYHLGWGQYIWPPFGLIRRIIWTSERSSLWSSSMFQQQQIDANIFILNIPHIISYVAGGTRPYEKVILLLVHQSLLHYSIPSWFMLNSLQWKSNMQCPHYPYQLRIYAASRRNSAKS